MIFFSSLPLFLSHRHTTPPKPAIPACSQILLNYKTHKTHKSN